MATEAARVVIIDDEPMVLQSLRSFLTLETDYDIETFDSPAAALEAAKLNPVDLVMTDYLMPGMNGIELLLAMKKFIPTRHACC